MIDPKLKQQALVEALEFYIYQLKNDNHTESQYNLANQVAIDLYTEVLKEVDPDSTYSVL